MAPACCIQAHQPSCTMHPICRLRFYDPLHATPSTRHFHSQEPSSREGPYEYDQLHGWNGALRDASHGRPCPHATPPSLNLCGGASVMHLGDHDQI
eukprot:CAMPEP_0184674488 /NCGR_PEP_ID=MMETSP0308-20130426/87263_1 /TAXON_ID=38269 /ORGANISM="Gloeochaete witrockiana, Strain SAG 46.84" /LENGTH=95 /DNA_ID=CAMNT_0027122093 /DNA_START=1966 /DNA_END=2253 /DNA_ORIENTATION=+